MDQAGDAGIVTTTQDRVDSLRERLEAHDQAHLLRFVDALTPDRQEALIEQIEAIDFVMLDDLVERFVRNHTAPALPADLAPAPYFAHDPDTGWDRDAMHAAGEALLRAGKVAAFTVAGGQGTRLGWNGPKGTYPGTPVTGKPLFRVFAEQIDAAAERYGAVIPWYIMTSPANDEATRAFFQDNNCFGLPRTSIMMFPQGTMPSLDKDTGRVLLADRDTIAVNPDGHGGSLRALRASGALDDMRARGIEHISYFQVDNPLVRVVDPVFLGLHAAAPESSAEMSSKMVLKAGPEEKVGVFGVAGGKTMVVEYSDLPDALAEARDEDGALRYCCGSIALHLLGVDFVERLMQDPHRSGLPFHRAVKPVPYVDIETGAIVTPEAANAVKLETFVFDAIPLAERSIVYETLRADEFAPIKNAEGADSAASSYRLQSERAARWLEAHGVTIPWRADGSLDAEIEISPRTALTAEDLAGVVLPDAIAAGDAVAL